MMPPLEWTYNAAGQLTRGHHPPPAATAPTATLTRDQTELVSQTVPGGASVAYGYGRTNGYGLPTLESVTKTAGTTTLNGYLDNDAGGTPEVFTTDQGVENYYVPDGTTGSPIALIDTSGAQTGAYSYDPYGTYTTDAGLNPARFAGGTPVPALLPWAPSTWSAAWSLELLERSHLEPRPEPPPAASLASLCHASDNPINLKDPTGEFSFGDVVSGVVGGLTGAITTTACTAGTFGVGLATGTCVLAGIGTGLIAGVATAQYYETLG